MKTMFTRRVTLLARFALWLVASFAHAQEPPLATGKYTGSYLPKARHGDTRRVDIDLIITAVQRGKVEGSVNRHAATCGGTYSVAGSYRDSQLALRGGPAGDCAISLRLAVDGNTLNGTVGQWPVVLMKAR